MSLIRRFVVRLGNHEASGEAVPTEECALAIVTGRELNQPALERLRQVITEIDARRIDARRGRFVIMPAGVEFKPIAPGWTAIITGKHHGTGLTFREARKAARLAWMDSLLGRARFRIIVDV
jgi:hypothetical protein